MPLPVGSLANSTYVLKVEATLGEQSAEQWVAFRVAVARRSRGNDAPEASRLKC